MPDMRRKLDELKMRTPRQLVTPAGPVRKRSVEEVLGGRERQASALRYWYVETPFEQVCAPLHVHARHLAGPLQQAMGHGESVEVEPARTVVLDIETGGFSGAPVFLIGVVFPDERPLQVVQLLARDYPEEEAILHALARLLARRDTWVTFNGKSFDEPFLRDRATLHRIKLPPVTLHVDLLHAARRRWRGELPDCRLVTLEEHILRRPRVGDVPSSDVPDLFHHFIRTGNAGPLQGVLEHNRIDLVSCTELLVRLSEPPG